MAQLNGWFDVTNYGVEFSKTATQAEGIKRAIDAAKAEGGGTIWFPPGKYCLGNTGGLELDHSNITLLGEGRSSTIVVTDPTSIPITVRNTSDVTIQDLSFVHDQGDISNSWEPRPYTETILLDTSGRVRLTNLHFENPTFGIKTLAVGAWVKIDRISGQPLMTGIQIENSRAEVTVDGIEFTPQWNSSPAVLNYQTGSRGLVAFKSVGNTVNNPRNVVFSHILATQCKVGFLFTGNGVHLGANTNQRIDEAANTSCVTGIQIEGPAKRLGVVNYTFVGLPGAASECAIHAYDDFGFLNVSDMRSIMSGANSIRIDRSSLALLSNVWLQDWAQSGKLFPAIESTHGTRVEVYQPYTFVQTSGSAAPHNVPQVSATDVYLF